MTTKFTVFCKLSHQSDLLKGKYRFTVVIGKHFWLGALGFGSSLNNQIWEYELFILLTGLLGMICSLWWKLL